jgi:hypothetical protein
MLLLTIRSSCLAATTELKLTLQYCSWLLLLLLLLLIFLLLLLLLLLLLVFFLLLLLLLAVAAALCAACFSCCLLLLLLLTDALLLCATCCPIPTLAAAAALADPLLGFSLTHNYCLDIIPPRINLMLSSVYIGVAENQFLSVPAKESSSRAASSSAEKGEPSHQKHAVTCC